MNVNPTEVKKKTNKKQKKISGRWFYVLEVFDQELYPNSEDQRKFGSGPG